MKISKLLNIHTSKYLILSICLLIGSAFYFFTYNSKPQVTTSVFHSYRLNQDASQIENTFSLTYPDEMLFLQDESKTNFIKSIGKKILPKFILYPSNLSESNIMGPRADMIESQESKKIKLDEKIWQLTTYYFSDKTVSIYYTFIDKPEYNFELIVDYDDMIKALSVVEKILITFKPINTIKSEYLFPTETPSPTPKVIIEKVNNYIVLPRDKSDDSVGASINSLRRTMQSFMDQQFIRDMEALRQKNWENSLKILDDASKWHYKGY